MAEGLSINSVLNLDVRKATEQARKFASQPLKLNLIIPTDDIFKEINRQAIKPIKVKIDRSEIEGAIASLERLNDTVRVSSSKISASINTRVNHIVKFDTLKYDSIVSKTVRDSGRELKRELQYLNKNVRQLKPNKLMSLLGFIGKTATAPLRLAGNVGKSALKNVFTGFTENIGRQLSGNITKSFSKDLSNYVKQKSTQFEKLIDVTFKDLLNFPGGLKQAQSLASRNVDTLINTVSNPQTYRGLENIFIELARLPKIDFETDETKNIIEKGINKYFKDLKDLMEENTSQFMGGALRVLAQIPRINTRINLGDSARVVLENLEFIQQELDETLGTIQKSKSDRIKRSEGILLAVGGVQPQESKPGKPNTESTGGLTNVLKGLLPNAYIEGVTPTLSNSLEELERGPLATARRFLKENEDVAREFLRKFTTDENINALFAQIGKMHPLDRVAQVNLEGRDEDAIKLAQNALSKATKFADKEVTLVGGSGGGYVVEKAIAILNEISYLFPQYQEAISRIKGVGVGTPLSGLTKTFDARNDDLKELSAQYTAFLGQLDHLGAAFFGDKFVKGLNSDNEDERRKAQQVLDKAVLTLPSGVLNPDKFQRIPENWLASFDHAIQLMVGDMFGVRDKEPKRLTQDFLHQTAPKSYKANVDELLKTESEINNYGKVFDKLNKKIEGLNRAVEIYKNNIKNNSDDVNTKRETALNKSWKNINLELEQAQQEYAQLIDKQQELQRLTGYSSKGFYGLGEPATNLKANDVFNAIKEPLETIRYGLTGKESPYYSFLDPNLDPRNIKQLAQGDLKDVSLPPGQSLLQMWNTITQGSGDKNFFRVAEPFEDELKELINNIERLANNFYDEYQKAYALGDQVAPLFQAINIKGGQEDYIGNFKKFGEKDPKTGLTAEPRIMDIMYKVAGITKDQTYGESVAAYQSSLEKIESLPNKEFANQIKAIVQSFLKIREKDVSLFRDYLRDVSVLQDRILQGDVSASQELEKVIKSSPFGRLQNVEGLAGGLVKEGKGGYELTSNKTRKILETEASQLGRGDDFIQEYANFIGLFAKGVKEFELNARQNIDALIPAIQAGQNLSEDVKKLATELAQIKATFGILDKTLQDRPFALNYLIKFNKYIQNSVKELGQLDLSQAKFLGSGFTGNVLSVKIGDQLAALKYLTTEANEAKIGSQGELDALTKLGSKGLSPELLGYFPEMKGLLTSQIQGRSLQDIRGDLGEDELREVVKLMGSLMRRIHDEGFTHNDMSMANVFMNELGKLQAIDFANAKKIESSQLKRTSENVRRIGSDDNYILKYVKQLQSDINEYNKTVTDESKKIAQIQIENLRVLGQGINSKALLNIANNEVIKLPQKGKSGESSQQQYDSEFKASQLLGQKHKEQLPGSFRTDFIDGYLLRDVFKESQSPELISNLLRQMGQSLSQIHQKGLFHGDFHTANVIASLEGLKSIDFGESRKLSDENDAAKDIKLAIQRIIADTGKDELGSKGFNEQKIRELLLQGYQQDIGLNYQDIFDQITNIKKSVNQEKNRNQIEDDIKRSLDRSNLNTPEFEALFREGYNKVYDNYVKFFDKFIQKTKQSTNATIDLVEPVIIEQEIQSRKSLNESSDKLTKGFNELKAQVETAGSAIASLDKFANNLTNKQTVKEPVNLPVKFQDKVGEIVKASVANKVNEKLLINAQGDVTPDKGQIVKLSDLSPGQTVAIAIRDIQESAIIVSKGATALNQGFNQAVSVLMPVISTLYKLDQGAKGFIKAIDPTGLSGLVIKGAETLLPAAAFSMVAGGTPVGHALGGAVGSVVHPLLGAGGDAIASGLSGSLGSSLTSVPLVGNQIGAAFNQGILEATGTVVNALSGISTDIATNVLGGQALKTLATKALNPVNEEKLRALPQATQDVIDHAVSMGNAMRREANKLLASSGDEDASKAVQAINSYLELTYLALQEAKLETKALPGSRKKGSLYNETKYLQGELTKDLNKIRTVYPEIVDVNTPQFSVSKQAVDAYEKEALRVSIRVREILEKGGDLSKVPNDILEGFRIGLKNGEGKLTKTAIALGKILPENVKKTLGIASPSKVFIAIMQNVLDTSVNVLEKGLPAIFTSGQKIANALSNGFKKNSTIESEFLDAVKVEKARQQAIRLTANLERRGQERINQGQSRINRTDEINRLNQEINAVNQNIKTTSFKQQLDQQINKIRQIPGEFLNQAIANLTTSLLNNAPKIQAQGDRFGQKIITIFSSIDRGLSRTVDTTLRIPDFVRVQGDRLRALPQQLNDRITQGIQNKVNQIGDNLINGIISNVPRIQAQGDKIGQKIITGFQKIDSVLSRTIDASLDIPDYLRRRNIRRRINPLLEQSGATPINVRDGAVERFGQSLDNALSNPRFATGDDIKHRFKEIRQYANTIVTNLDNALDTPRFATGDEIKNSFNKIQNNVINAIKRFIPDKPIQIEQKPVTDTIEQRIENTLIRTRKEYYKALDRMYLESVDYSQYLTRQAKKVNQSTQVLDDSSTEQLRQSSLNFVQQIRQASERINLSRDLFRQNVLFEANQLQPKIEGTRQTLINRVGEGSQAEVERKAIRQDSLNIEAKIYQLKQRSLGASVEQQALINKEYQELTQVLRTNQQKTKELNEQIKIGRIAQQQIQQLANAERELNNAIKANNAQRIKSATRNVQGLRNVINQGNIARDFLGNIRQLINTVAGDFVSKLPPAIQKVTGLIKGMGAAIAGYLASTVFNAYDIFFRLQYGIQRVITTGTELESVEVLLNNVGLSFDQASEKAIKYATNIKESARGYAQLATATQDSPLEGEGAEKIYDSLLQASRAYNLSAEETNGVLLAMRQILSDSVLQMQDFNQLAERVPGIIGIASRAMNVAVTDFRQLNSEGVFSSQKFAQNLASQLALETQNKVGNSLNTTQANIEKFRNELQLLEKALFGNFSGGFNVAVKGLTQMMSVAVPLIPIIGSLGKALALIGAIALIQKIPTIIGFFQNLGINAPLVSSALNGASAQAGRFFSMFEVNLPRMATEIKTGLINGIANLQFSFVGLQNVAGRSLATIRVALAKVGTAIAGVLNALGPLVIVGVGIDAITKLWGENTMATKNAEDAIKNYMESYKQLLEISDNPQDQQTSVQLNQEQFEKDLSLYTKISDPFVASFSLISNSFKKLPELIDSNAWNRAGNQAGKVFSQPIGQTLKETFDEATDYYNENTRTARLIRGEIVERQKAQEEVNKTYLKFNQIRQQIKEGDVVDPEQVKETIALLEQRNQTLKDAKPLTDVERGDIQSERNDIESLLDFFNEYQSTLEEFSSSYSDVVVERKKAIDDATNYEVKALQTLEEKYLQGLMNQRQYELEKQRITRNRINAELQAEENALARLKQNATESVRVKLDEQLAKARLENDTPLINDLERKRQELNQAIADNNAKALSNYVDKAVVEEMTSLEEKITEANKKAVIERLKYSKLERDTKIEDAQKTAEAKINLNEQEQTLELLKLEKQGVIDKEQAEQAKEKITLERLEAELKAEEKKLKEIAKLNDKDSAEYQQQLQARNAKEIELLNEQLKTKQDASEKELAIAEKTRLNDILKLEQQGVINKEQAEKLKAEATLKRAKFELEVEQKKLEAIAKAQGEASEAYLEQQLKVSEKAREALDLEISLQNSFSDSLSNIEEFKIIGDLREIEEIVDSVTAAVDSTVLSNAEWNEYVVKVNKELRETQKAIRGLELNVQVFDNIAKSIESLESARSELFLATNNKEQTFNDLRIDQLRRALEIRKQLTEEEDLSSGQRKLLLEELASLGVNGRKSEIAILKEIRAIEQKNAELKEKAIREEFRLKEKLFELEVKRSQLEARRGVLEARQQLLEAQKALADFENTWEAFLGGEEAFKPYREALELAQENLKAQQDYLGVLDEVNRMKAEQLQIEKDIALQTEKTNQSTQDYSTRGEIAEANRDEIGILKEQEKQRIKEARDKARGDKDAQSNLKETIAQIRQETQEGIDRIKEERRRGNNIVTPVIKPEAIAVPISNVPIYRPPITQTGGIRNAGDMIDLKGVRKDLNTLINTVKNINKPNVNTTINVPERDLSDMIRTVGNRVDDVLKRNLNYGY